MNNILLHEVLQTLSVDIWHTTSLDCFQSILADGAILVEPDIDDSKRWKTSGGPKYYPFVRTLGGISLFDFQGFDVDEYDKACPMSSWREFVPFREAWGTSIWLKFELMSENKAYIAPSELQRLLNEQKAHRHTLMPRIEAAHIGDLPMKLCSGALKISSEGIERLDLRRNRELD